ncbi:MAG: MATE family efflux transporter, partial [Aeromonadaceae bacterium]
WPTMFIGFIGLVINIPANYILIYGKFGFPALGAVGCGVASALVFWAMCLTMWLYVRRSSAYAGCRPFTRWVSPDRAQMLRIFKLGFPIALALFCEVTLFTLVALLLSPLGSQIVASHQVALNFSSLVFMLPLSLGFAVTIRVGHSIGEKEPDKARIATLSGLGIGLMLALLTALFTVLAREWIAEQYSQDAAVIALASHLMLFAAIYQLSDTVQVVSSGALRGYKDTRMIFFITMLAYWGLGLPTGVILGLTDWVCPKMGPAGFWIGFIVGLTSAALLFGARMKRIFRQFANS